MQRTHKKFDPVEQFDSLMVEVESALVSAKANFERLAFLREKIAAEHAATQAAADEFQVQTEAEAGLLFQLNDDPTKAERAMRDLRRRHDLPHCRFGRDVRYTREQLREIAAILEVNGKRRKSTQASPLKLAA